MSRFAIIPAKSRSSGIPGKNWKPLNGLSPVDRALNVCAEVGFDRVIVSADDCPILPTWWEWLQRPPALCADDTPMVDVVRHAMESRILVARNEMWTGARNPEDEDIFCLIQPTQPLREPKHITAAIALLESSKRGSVVSVVGVEPAQKLLVIGPDGDVWESASPKERRQECIPSYKRDGTVYAWRRKDGYLPKPWWPLVIPPEETAALDTPFDWHEAERRLREKEGIR